MGLKITAALPNRFSSGIEIVVERMKIDSHRDTGAMSPRMPWLRIRANGGSVGFTLIEVMISLALLLILIVSSFSAIFTFRSSAGSLATYTAATAVVEGRLEAIRNATYNPPNSPFLTASTFVTNFSEAIWLDKGGTNLLVPGTVVCQIQPVTGGHLVTATGTFTTRGKTNVISLQTLVNKFSGGQN